MKPNAQPTSSSASNVDREVANRHESETPTFFMYEELGELLDAVMAEQRFVVFYTPLMNRHLELFQKAGITDSIEVKKVLQKIRPQYRYELQYLTVNVLPERFQYMNDFSLEQTTDELVRIQIRQMWGESETTTLNKLVERTYIPNRLIEFVLESKKNYEFQQKSKGLYSIERYLPDKNPDDVSRWFSVFKERANFVTYYDIVFPSLSATLSHNSEITSPDRLRDFLRNLDPPQARCEEEYMVVPKSFTGSFDELVLGEALMHCSHLLMKEYALSRRLTPRTPPKLKRVKRPPTDKPFKGFSESALLDHMAIPADVLRDVLLRQQNYLYQIRDGATPALRLWGRLGLDGRPYRLSKSDVKKITEEVVSPEGNVFCMLHGLPYSPPAFPDANAHTESTKSMEVELGSLGDDPSSSKRAAATRPEPTTPDAAPTEPQRASSQQSSASEASRMIPKKIAFVSACIFDVLVYIDRLVASGHVVLFFSSLKKACIHQFGCDAIGDEEFRTALGRFRPQYLHMDGYIFAPSKDESASPSLNELLRRQFANLWGTIEEREFDEIVETSLVPQETLKEFLDASDDFEEREPGVYAILMPHDTTPRRFLKRVLKLNRELGIKALSYRYDVIRRYTARCRLFRLNEVEAVQREIIALANEEEFYDFGDYLSFANILGPNDAVALGEFTRRLYQRVVEMAKIYRMLDPTLSDDLVFRPFSFQKYSQNQPPQIDELLLKQRKFFELARPYEKESNRASWFCLNSAGRHITLADVKELEEEITNPDSELNRFIEGRPIERPVYDLPVSSYAERDAAREEIGEIVDALFSQGHTIVYYSKLFERHRETFKRAQFEDYSIVQSLLHTIRPAYSASESYVTPTETSQTVYELTQNEIINGWGDSRIKTVVNLTKELYAPQMVVQKALYSDALFKDRGRGAYELKKKDLSKAQKKSKKQEPLETTPTVENAATANLETVEKVEKTAPNVVENVVETKPSTVASPTSESSEDLKADATSESTRQEAPTCEESKDSNEQRSTLKPTIETRIQGIVEALLATGHNLAYYRTLLERHKILARTYKDEDALHAALKELYPSFGYRETYFEPRRRSDDESEDVKLRRALILGWSDVGRQKLDRLAKLFTIPSSLIERTLKRYADDFVAEGKGRFRITEAARNEADAIRQGVARLHDEFRQTMANDSAILHYATYFKRNREPLETLGISDVKTLRRELANESKSAGLGYVFYKNYCEATPSKERYQTKLRRLVDLCWGDAPETTLKHLASQICAPSAEIRDVLIASLDFRYCGGDVFQKVNR